MAAVSEARVNAPYHLALTAYRRALVEHALIAVAGNRSRAADRLGIQRTYLLRLMRELRIDVPATHERANGWVRKASLDAAGEASA